MPKISIPVSGSAEFQDRQVGYSIANDILREMRYNKTAEILLTNEDGDIIQEGTSLRRWKNKDNVRNTENGNRLTIKVNKEIVEDLDLTYPTRRHTEYNRPIFADRALGVYIVPVYVPVKMTINFALDFVNIDLAKKWSREAIRRFAEGREDAVHKVKYSYLIPHEFTYMLHEFYKLRENVAGYGDTFAQWLDSSLDGRIAAITNIVGNVSTAQLSVPEVAQGVKGYFDGPFEYDAAQKENPSSKYRIEFDYVVFYEDVTNLIMDYPVMIHNQILPEGKLRDNPLKQIRFTDPAKGHAFTHWDNNQKFFRDHRHNKSFLSTVPGYNIPSFDEFEFSVDKISSFYEHYFSVLIEVDLNAPRSCFSLLDLEDNGEDSLTFSEEFKAFFAQEFPHVHEVSNSVFHVRHYDSLNKNVFYKVSCNGSDLSIRTIHDMNPRNINHISFFICTDLRRLSTPALTRLLCWPNVLREIFRIIQKEAVIPVLPEGKCLTMEHLDVILRDVYGEGILGNGRRTVGNAILLARRH